MHPKLYRVVKAAIELRLCEGYEDQGDRAAEAAEIRGALRHRSVIRGQKGLGASAAEAVKDCEGCDRAAIHARGKKTGEVEQLRLQKGVPRSV